MANESCGFCNEKFTEESVVTSVYGVDVHWACRRSYVDREKKKKLTIATEKETMQAKDIHSEKVDGLNVDF